MRDSKWAVLPRVADESVGHLFPFKEIYEWLSYAKTEGSPGEFGTREFSFVLMTPSNEEIYVRNQSYASLEQFQAEMTKASPHKIDIGGIYNAPVSPGCPN